MALHGEWGLLMLERTARIAGRPGVGVERLIGHLIAWKPRVVFAARWALPLNPIGVPRWMLVPKHPQFVHQMLAAGEAPEAPPPPKRDALIRAARAADEDAFSDFNTGHRFYPPMLESDRIESARTTTRNSGRDAETLLAGCGRTNNFDLSIRANSPRMAVDRGFHSRVIDSAFRSARVFLHRRTAIRISLG